jgi:transcription elongation factor Elf1
MHCSHCKSLMAEVGVQRDNQTEQTRYECPVCQRTELITRHLVHWRNDLSVSNCRIGGRVLRHV